MTNLSVSDLAGRRIREIRKRRRWTVRDLADRCAEIGAPRITATVITNLETRRRATREITADELLVIAYALEVAPALLMSPLNGDEQLEIVPGVSKDILEAAAWIADDDVFLGSARRVTSHRQEDTERMLRWRASALTVVRQIRLVASAIRIRDRDLSNEKWRDRYPSLVGHNEDSIVVLGIRLLHLLDSLGSLEYTPPEMPDVMDILKRRGVPATLREWQEEAAEDDLSLPGDEGGMAGDGEM